MAGLPPDRGKRLSDTLVDPAEARGIGEGGRRLLEEHFAARPTRGTLAGDHRFDGELDDCSQAGLRSETNRLREVLARLGRADETTLGPDERLDLAVLKREMERCLFELGDLHEPETNPLIYEEVAGNGLHALLARDYEPLAERLISARFRMEALGDLFSAARHNLGSVSRPHAEVALIRHAGLTPLLDRLRAAASQVPDPGPAWALALRKARLAVAEHGRWIETTLLPRADADWRLGPKLHARKLDLCVGGGLDGAEIVRRAQAALATAREEMAEAAARMKLPLAQALDQVAGDHPPRAGLVDAAREALGEIAAFLRERALAPLPEEPLSVEATPPFLRGVYTASLDAPGPLDRGQRAWYYISPIPDDWTPERAESQLREYNQRMLRVLGIHEVYPGHYVQRCRAIREPRLFRELFASGTLCEGWAVYCERMMIEEGFGGGDPGLLLMQRKFFLRTVLNAILDVGLHAQGMDEAEALRMLMEIGGQERSEAEGKLVRARVTSGQLCTYFVGQEAVRALRAQSGLGAREFHEKLLAEGSAPPELISRKWADLR